MTLAHSLKSLVKSAANYQSAQDGIVRELRSAFDLSRVNILLYNKAANMLETVSSVGHTQADFRDIRTPVIKMEGFSSRAVQVRSFLNKRQIVVNDRGLDPEYRARARFPHKKYAREFAIFPLLAGSHRLGILSIAVEHDNPVRLTPRLVREVAKVCPAISGVIHATMPRVPTDRQMVKVLKDILTSRLIYPVYQPIVDLKRRRVVAYEALMRADHPLIAGPVILLGYAEKFNEMRNVSQEIHEAALKIVPRLGAGQKLFLNLDVGDFGEYLKLDRPSNPFHGLDPHRFVLEITERQYADDIERLRGLFVSYRDLGFGVAIDDLGSGYSSLNILPTLRPDYIKLDISLICGIEANKRQQELVRALLGFADRTGMRCICEGVERREELRTLIRLGARYIQGFVIARPHADLLSAAELRARLDDLL